MKKFLLLIASIVSLSADNALLSNATATNTAIATVPIVLQSFTLWTTNTTPTLVYLQDGAYTTAFGAYTNYIGYSTNKVTTYVTTTGVTNTLTNNVYVTIANPVAAVTNVTAATRSYVVPPAVGGVPQLLTVNELVTFASKLTLTNNLPGLSGFFTYRVR